MWLLLLVALSTTCGEFIMVYIEAEKYISVARIVRNARTVVYRKQLSA